MDEDLAIEVEAHEAAVWSRLVEETRRVPGDPLRARLDEALSVPLVALTALDVEGFNRVVGLGVAEETSASEVAALLAWYASHGQERLLVEVAPVAHPTDLADLLVDQGLARTGRRRAKLWREAAAPPVHDGREVVDLGPEDRDEVAAVSVAAAGLPAQAGPWFAAAVGAPGFRHVGVRDAGRLVCVGAMYVSDGIAWLGLDAVLPAYQGRGLHRATLARRVAEAVTTGCWLLHAESGDDEARQDLLGAGFAHLYDKELFAPRRR